MSVPSNAREALIAELVGEVSALLDRVDSLVPAINATCDAITRAGADLEANAGLAERRLVALTKAAEAHAIKNIARRTEALTRNSEDAQSEALRRAAGAAVTAELAPVLRQLVQRQSLHAAEWRPKGGWWAHAATAICAAALGAAAAAYALSAWAP